MIGLHEFDNFEGPNCFQNWATAIISGLVGILSKNVCSFFGSCKLKDEGGTFSFVQSFGLWSHFCQERVQLTVHRPAQCPGDKNSLVQWTLRPMCRLLSRQGPNGTADFKMIQKGVAQNWLKNRRNRRSGSNWIWKPSQAVCSGFTNSIFDLWEQGFGASEFERSHHFQSSMIQKLGNVKNRYISKQPQLILLFVVVSPHEHIPLFRIRYKRCAASGQIDEGENQDSNGEGNTAGQRLACQVKSNLIRSKPKALSNSTKQRIQTNYWFWVGHLIKP